MTVYLTTNNDKYEINKLSEYTSYIDVYNLMYCFNRHGIVSIYKPNGDELSYRLSSENDTVIIRSTNNQVSLFGKVINKLLNIKLDRPVESLTTKGAAKINSEINKHADHENKINWWFVTSYEALVSNIHHISFPVVYKPSSGSHGEGIMLLGTPQELLTHVSSNHDWRVPVFLQEFLDKKFEYRVIAYNGEVIASARKMLKTRSGNQFGGRRFTARTLHTDYINYVRSNSREGLVGIDIIRERGTNMIYIIEENRAPEFEAVDRATGLDTARLVVEKLQNEQS